MYASAAATWPSASQFHPPGGVSHPAPGQNQMAYCPGPCWNAKLSLTGRHDIRVIAVDHQRRDGPPEQAGGGLVDDARFAGEVIIEAQGET
jgi:hypothetical protein